MLTQNFKDILKYATASMFVKPKGKEEFSPVNLLLIAPPECAKTRLLNEILCKKTLKTLDLSPKSIKEAILPRLESGETKFLIIPDLIQLLGHKKQTTGSTVGFLNALIEEGVKDNNFYGLEFHLSKVVNCGLLTAVTTDKFYENVYDFNSIGFLHRIIPVAYDYSYETIQKIQNDISSGTLFKDINEISTKTNNKLFEVTIPNKYSVDILLLVNRLTDKLSKFKIRSSRGIGRNRTEDVYFDIKGFRLHIRLRQLARAICFIDGKGKRKEVNSDDIIKLYSISEVINLPNTKKVI